MTRKEQYSKMVQKYDLMIEEAKKVHNITGAKRDKEYLDYLKLRRSRYIL